MSQTRPPMGRLPPEDDLTVRLPPGTRLPMPASTPAAPAATPRARNPLPALLLAGLAGLALLGGAAWLLWPATPPVAPPVAQAPAEPQPPPLLGEAAILAHRATAPTALRWSGNPLVWVLDFPDLASQGAAMNRAAAFIEKARTPRDRVLTDAELAQAIAADERDTGSYYYGHNYRSSALERMFAMADAAGIALNPSEQWLRDQVALARRIAGGEEVAILTIPGLGASVDQELRATILRHELSHGQFFTLPDFHAHVMRVWREGFTEAEREAVRAFLGGDGYDTSQEEMMANEAMAYLLYTPDARVFDPAEHLRFTPEQTTRLRRLLMAGAPALP